MLRDRRQYIIVRLKEQIWRERRVFVFLVVVLLGVILFQRWAVGFYAIRVNGAVVVWAKSRQAAREIIRGVEQREGGSLPPNVATKFAEHVQVKRERFTGDEIPDLQEAEETLLPHLSLLVRAPVVMVNGEAKVAVPSSETAELVLREVKRRLGPTVSDGEVVDEKFKEKVEIKDGEMPVALFQDEVEGAAEVLAGKKGGGPGSSPVLTWACVVRQPEPSQTTLTAGTSPGMVEVTYENGKETARKPVG